MTCSTLVAPAITELISGLDNNQEKASSNTECFRSMQNCSNFSKRSKLLSVNIPLSSSDSLVPLGASWDSFYLPVKNTLARG